VPVDAQKGIKVAILRAAYLTCTEELKGSAMFYFGCQYLHLCVLFSSGLQCV
jgi:hypothetical protein